MTGVGGAISAIELLAQLFGFDLPENSIAAGVNGLVAFVGLVLLIWGQWRRGDVKSFFFKKAKA